MKFRIWSEEDKKYLKDSMSTSYFVTQEGKIYESMNDIVTGKPFIIKLPKLDYVIERGFNSPIGYLYENDKVILDSTEIGGGIIEGYIYFNGNPDLSRYEFGIWTKDGYAATDFMGRIKYIGNQRMDIEPSTNK